MKFKHTLRRWASKTGDAALLVYERAVMPLWSWQAARRRQRYCRSYIAVSGSCGKTTTSMLTHRLIGAQKSAELGIVNNTGRWSLRSLRKLDHFVDYMIQEVSEYPVATIETVGKVARPDAVIVTSVGLDHITAFRNREAVAATLRTLTSTVPAGGVLCLSADDPLARSLAESTPARIVLFGLSRDADVRAASVNAQLPGRLSFDLEIGGRSWPVKTRFVGTLMLPNILAALAMVYAQGLDIDRAIADLEGIEPLFKRMSVLEVPDGHSYVLDIIKAPLWSTRLLVDDLPHLHGGRRIFVLGAMSDLGPNESQKYRQVLRAASKVADLVVGIGRSGEQAARLRGLEPRLTNVVGVQTMDDLATLLLAQEPGLVLLKGNKFDCRSLMAAVAPGAAYA